MHALEDEPVHGGEESQGQSTEAPISLTTFEHLPHGAARDSVVRRPA
jgi:hypothetical protein